MAVRTALGADVTLLDTADAVAHRILTLLEEHHQPTDDSAVLWTSGDPAAIARFTLRWLATPMEVRPLPC